MVEYLRKDIKILKFNWFIVNAKRVTFWCL